MARARAYGLARAPDLRPDLGERRGLRPAQINLTHSARTDAAPAQRRDLHATWIQHIKSARCPSQPHGRDRHSHTRLDITQLRYTQSHTQNRPLPCVHTPHIIRRPVYAAAQQAFVCARAKMRVRQGLGDAARAAPPNNPALSISPASARAVAPSCRQITRRTQSPAKALIATGTRPPRCLTYSTRAHRQSAQRASTQPAHTHTQESSRMT